MDLPKIKLKAARVNAGLTQVEAAGAMHRNKQTIINWETGATEIRYRDLAALSELYGIPVEYLEVPQRRIRK
ncbi:MAG: helix-turn-helix domain-containing protein [Lachnospiraceae bacterium]|nr:helix-turn-helix domain-containing protein [Lachnospiraceae bacterium]